MQPSASSISVVVAGRLHPHQSPVLANECGLAFSLLFSSPEKSALAFTKIVQLV
jgi:hypothetical protein